MLGIYEDFPEPVHGIAHFDYYDPVKRVQQAILYSLHNLNHQIYDLGAVSQYLKQKCEVSFEFGVAEGVAFNFLDKKELDQCLRAIDEKELELLDFFSVVRYHLIREEKKRVPLKFDYHVIRFTFQQNELRLQIRHERGTQRIPLDDLVDFLARQINSELTRRQLNPLVLGGFEKVRLQ